MRRHLAVIAILVMLGLIFAQAALAEGTLSETSAGSISLVPAQWLDEGTQYILRTHKTPITASAELFALAGDDSGISLDTDVTDSKLPGCEAAAMGLYPLSVSTNGGVTLLTNGQELYIMRGAMLTAVSMNLSRSAYTEKYMYTQVFRFMSMDVSQWVGTEGFVWSPDGRYVSINNARMFLQQRRSIHGLLLLDIEKGELFSAKAYEMKSEDEHFGAVTGTCFDETGRYLYYLEYGENVTTLGRYDLNEGSHESLCTVNGITFCPGLGFNSQGGLECILYEGKNPWQTTFLEMDGHWSSESTPLQGLSSPVFFVQLPSGAGFTQSWAKTKEIIMLFNLADHDDTWLTVPLVNGRIAEYAVPMPALETENDAQIWWGEFNNAEPKQLYVMHIALSPDNTNALLAVRNQFTKEETLLLMDEMTLALKVVNTSALSENKWIMGSIRFGQNKQYPPGLTFVGKDLVLVPITSGETRLYRLESK